ncbi:hypothetical protein JZ751_010733, partial [Albula glossodonta]
GSPVLARAGPVQPEGSPVLARAGPVQPEGGPCWPVLAQFSLRGAPCWPLLAQFSLRGALCWPIQPEGRPVLAQFSLRGAPCWLSSACSPVLQSLPAQHSISYHRVITKSVMLLFMLGALLHPFIWAGGLPVLGGYLQGVTCALTVGLVRQCQTIHGRDRTCIPPRLPPEWVTTLFFIIMGIVSLTVTCGLLVASHWRREATKYARWIAFTGMILLCMAALIFPIGFYINEVGGQPYKLPNNTVVGSSYVLFVLSIFFTIVGLLFAGKVCLPG